ncbi:MAG: hypothetical protein WA865_20715 [Spirulinaceae cyanobacterium]
MLAQESPSNSTFEMKFHYINGKTQSFQIQRFDSAGQTEQDIRQHLRHFFQENWWMLRTHERTYMINSANILHVEITPSITNYQGEGFLCAELPT